MPSQPRQLIRSASWDSNASALRERQALEEVGNNTLIPETGETFTQNETTE